MPDKILKVLRWGCLLLAGMISWQVYGIVTAPEPFDRLDDLVLDDLALEAPAPAAETEAETTVPTPAGPPADGEKTTSTPAPSADTSAETTAPTPAGPPADEEKTPSTPAHSADTNAETPAPTPAGPPADGETMPSTPASKKAAKPAGVKKKKAEPSSPPFPPALEIIATSGFLGKAPTKKPAPPALVGTLGKYALIRAPDGKEDLVAEGGEFGGVKVIKIATNRVLIEHQGQQTELTIYAGMGSSSLLPKKKPEKKADATEKKADTPEKKTDTPEISTSTDSSKAPATPDSWQKKS